MCGILGYYTTSKKDLPETMRRFSRVFAESQSRGSDASGIACIESRKSGNTLYYHKEAVNATKFIKSRDYARFLDTHKPKIVIAHTRAQTKGESTNNYNNHPLIAKSGLGIVHNGVLTNDDEVFKQFNLKRDGQVDSEIIVKLLEHYRRKKKHSNKKAIQKIYKTIEGGMAIAYLDASQPRTLWLGASSYNNIAFAWHEKTKTIFFASTNRILKSGLPDMTKKRSIFRKTNISDFLILDENNSENMGYKITARKIEQFKLERPAYSYQKKSENKQKKATFKQTEIEKQTEKDYQKKANKQIPPKPGYTSVNPIKKPSQYNNDQLWERLLMLEIEADNAVLSIGQKQETRRIVNTLRDRYHGKNAQNVFPDDLLELKYIEAQILRPYTN